MTTQTARHLETWLSKYVPEDDREQALERILAFVADYPELILVENRSWSEIRAIGDRYALARSAGRGPLKLQ